MGQRLRVDYRESRGRGLLHLGGVERGPAGDAGLAVQTGLAVRFDVVAVPAITESIVDLDEVDDAVLSTLFGPDGPALRGTGLDELTIADDREPLLWLASRQAVLLLHRELPIVPGPIDRWSVEACLLWAALEDEGLPVQEHTDREIERMAPVLAELPGPSFTRDSIPGRAVLLATDRLPPSAPASGAVADIADAMHPGTTDALDATLAALEPQLLERVSMMGDRSHRADEQLWMSLPRDCYPDGRFSGLLTVESYLVGYTDRLRISLPATTAGPSLPLFVRIVANDGSEPEVIAVAALTVEEDAGHTVEMDQPERFDAVGTRIEIVRDLNLPLLPAKNHTATRAAQWALLALRACRTGSPSSGRTWWLRSSDLYADAGDDRRAGEAEANADLAASDLGHGPFWVESLDHDNPTSDLR